MSPFLWSLLRRVQFWVLDLILSSGLTVQHSLTYCLDHEQLLTTVKDRAIIFQLEKLLTMDSLRAVWHLETVAERMGSHEPGQRYQLLMLRKVRGEAKIGGSQWWWQVYCPGQVCDISRRPWLMVLEGVLSVVDSGQLWSSLHLGFPRYPPSFLPFLFSPHTISLLPHHSLL